MNRTYTPKEGSIDRKWHVVDAAGVPVGCLAGQVAQVLRGKHKPTFTYNADCGDFVIIINAGKAKLTGNKRLKSTVHHYTGYIGGFRSATYGEMIDKKPVQLMERVVKGMLPRTRLKMHRKLKVYAGPEHPHGAQCPVTIEV